MWIAEIQFFRIETRCYYRRAFCPKFHVFLVFFTVFCLISRFSWCFSLNRNIKRSGFFALSNFLTQIMFPGPSVFPDFFLNIKRKTRTKSYSIKTPRHIRSTWCTHIIPGTRYIPAGYMRNTYNTQMWYIHAPACVCSWYSWLRVPGMYVWGYAGCDTGISVGLPIMHALVVTHLCSCVKEIAAVFLSCTM